MSNVVLTLVFCFSFGINLREEYQTSGKGIKRDGGRSVVLVAIILSLFCVYDVSSRHAYDLWGAPMLVFGVYMIIRGFLYFWYVGSLKNIRRRHVEKQRTKWQAELKKLEERSGFLGGQMQAMLECGREYESDVYHNEAVIGEIRQKANALRWNLDHITCD